MKRVYWDACCFIDFLQGSSRGEILKGVVDKNDSGELLIVTSAITLTEVLKLGDCTAADREKIVKTFSQDRGLLIVDLTRHLAELSRDLIWEYGFEKHSKDAIHLATAKYIHQFRNIGEFHTFDHDLLKLDGDEGVPFSIVEPTFETYPPKQESLF